MGTIDWIFFAAVVGCLLSPIWWPPFIYYYEWWWKKWMGNK